MGFVEDHDVRFRDQLAKSTLFNHHIRQKEMMVYHHHIGVHRFFTCFDHKAIFIHRAVAAKTVVVGAGDQRPRL
ncbi:Uncharacterised protein [Shigella sonnei]|nr:Uncharacterised protein [Shigella sonnei]SRN45887.1 Uncharacterised protein [Shigella flexneri]